MAAILVIASIICGCFVTIDGQSVVDETDSSGECLWNNEEYMRESFERTCRPAQQLLVQVKLSVDSISDQLATIRDRGPQTTTREKIVEDKQFLVSALTGKFGLI